MFRKRLIQNIIEEYFEERQINLCNIILDSPKSVKYIQEETKLTLPQIRVTLAVLINHKVVEPFEKLVLIESEKDVLVDCKYRLIEDNVIIRAFFPHILYVIKEKLGDIGHYILNILFEFGKLKKKDIFDVYTERMGESLPFDEDDDVEVDGEGDQIMEGKKEKVMSEFKEIFKIMLEEQFIQDSIVSGGEMVKVESIESVKWVPNFDRLSKLLVEVEIEKFFIENSNDLKLDNIDVGIIKCVCKYINGGVEAKDLSHYLLDNYSYVKKDFEIEKKIERILKRKFIRVLSLGSDFYFLNIPLAMKIMKRTSIIKIMNEKFGTICKKIFDCFDELNSTQIEESFFSRKFLVNPEVIKLGLENLHFFGVLKLNVVDVIYKSEEKGKLRLWSLNFEGVTKKVIENCHEILLNLRKALQTEENKYYSKIEEKTGGLGLTVQEEQWKKDFEFKRDKINNSIRDVLGILAQFTFSIE